MSVGTDLGPGESLEMISKGFPVEEGHGVHGENVQSAQPGPSFFGRSCVMLSAAEMGEESPGSPCNPCSSTASSSSERGGERKTRDPLETCSSAPVQWKAEFIRSKKQSIRVSVSVFLPAIKRLNVVPPFYYCYEWILKVSQKIK